jgi:hypothetical protein
MCQQIWQREVIASSAMTQGMTSFASPVPRVSWDSDDYKGRLAFVRTVNDAAGPLIIQQMMIDETGVEWIIRDMGGGHSPQISHPERLASILVDLTKTCESVWHNSIRRRTEKGIKPYLDDCKAIIC